MGSTLSSVLSSSGDPEGDHWHTPTPDDVYEVRQALLAYVPAELANKIIDDAHYWPKVSYSMAVPADEVNQVITQRHGPVCSLVTPRLSDWIGLEERVHIKEVYFKVKSHDQGWCDENSSPGKYGGSWTWFEAAIIRGLACDSDLPEGDVKARIGKALDSQQNDDITEAIVIKNPDSGLDVWHIQRNIRASSTPVVHEVVWTDTTPDTGIDEEMLLDTTGAGRGTGFIPLLRLGDRIAVIARAMYPGWANYVAGVEVEVSYSV
ncbi:hypothetical protein GALMADRAFT_224488 [Galerina marginata CBS 339.88]|uniref:Uncharacterized protein n=1 Tax=Galerina marginata (strain CBS 339.88) TaxID=685588 RepID=A0A067T4P4_GALM3|nr:hypothetical protein GALMADRAFT_224488 [Galerina marginata CBS 339.88]